MRAISMFNNQQEHKHPSHHGGHAKALRNQGHLPTQNDGAHS